MSQEVSELRAHLDDRLDRLEAKIDDHRGRLAAAETSVDWLRGTTRLIITVLVGIIGSVISAYLRLTKG